VALLIDVLTDNRNRTSGDVRAVFSKFGGAMAEPGAVGWQFSRRGVIIVDGRAGEDAVMEAALEAGADDVARDGDAWRVTTEPSVVFDVKAALESAGMAVVSAESTMVSSNLVPVDDVEDARKVLRIMDALEDNDDVQDVYSNFDMSDDVMSAASA
jgi:YebC/PmpR family DNA-binding regulatory protein